MVDISGNLRGEQRRRQLYQAGRRLLMEKSVTDLKVSDIVKAADMSQGTFYNYFRDKEGFMISLSAEMLLPYRVSIRERRSNSSTAEEFARRNFEAIADMCKQDREMCDLLGTPLNDFREYFYAPRVVTPIMEDMTEDLQQGIQTGMFRPHDVDRLSAVSITFLLDLLNTVARQPDMIERRVNIQVELFTTYLSPAETGSPAMAG